jgi:hypothetical protein
MKRILIGIVVLGSFLMSCQPDVKPCSEERSTAAIVAESPDSLKVGDEYTLIVKYVLENSCGSFDRFDVTKTDNCYEVELMTKYEGCNCDLAYTEEAVDYTIDVDFPGTYEFKFWQADGDYDSRTIVIFQ